MMSQVANLFQYYQKWVFEEKKTFSEHFNKNQLIYNLKKKNTRTKQNSSKDVSVPYFQIHQYKPNTSKLKT